MINAQLDYKNTLSETPRDKSAGVLIGSLSILFSFEIIASQFGPSQDKVGRWRGTIADPFPSAPFRTVRDIFTSHGSQTTVSCLAFLLACHGG
jgi:hypothetical protein